MPFDAEPCALPSVLYIAGYSRSGSTVLDMLLGSDPSIASTGELTFLLDDAAAGRRCSCGASYRDCPLYGPWLYGSEGARARANAALIRQIENRLGYQRQLKNAIPWRAAAIYRHAMRSLFRHIAQECGASVVLDSSKTAAAAAGRALALRRIAELDVKVLHLTRDPRAVIGSYLRNGSNWVAEGLRQKLPLDTFRPVIGWQVANRIALDLERLWPPGSYFRLRYEDLRRDPNASLKAIEQALELDLSGARAALERGAPLLAHHNVGGNRARHHPQTLRSGAAANVRLPVAHELTLGLTASRLMRNLGYGSGA